MLCNLRCQTRVVEHEGDVGFERTPLSQLKDALQQEGGHALAADALLFGLGQGLGDDRGDRFRWNFKLLRDGVGNQLMVVRACYVVEPLFPLSGAGLGLTRDASGGYQIIAASGYVAEP